MNDEPLGKKDDTLFREVEKSEREIEEVEEMEKVEGKKRLYHKPSYHQWGGEKHGKKGIERKKRGGVEDKDVYMAVR